MIFFQGFVPKALLSSEPIEFPEKVFYYGQVVRCKVVKVDPSEGKLRLTFMVCDGTVQSHVYKIFNVAVLASDQFW